MRRHATIIIALTLAPLSCGGAEDPMMGPEHEACGAMGAAAGPTEIAAGADSSSSAPAVEDHTAYHVSLTAGAAGYVRYTAAEAGDFLVFLSEDEAPTLTDEAGTTVVSEADAAVGMCSELSHSWTYPLAVGVYYLGFDAPTVDTEVSLVIAEGGHGTEGH